MSNETKTKSVKRALRDLKEEREKSGEPKSVKRVLRDLKEEREKSGLTLSDKQIAFLVKVVEECAG